MRMFTLFLAAFLTALNVSVNAQAVVPDIKYDVELYVAADGDDSNEGLVPESALKTLHYALKAAEQPLTEGLNVRINVAAGEYKDIGNVGKMKGEEHDSWLCIQGDPENPPLFDGSNYESGRGFLVTGKAQNVIIRNFRFINFIHRSPITIGYNLSRYDIRNILLENIESTEGTGGIQVKSGARKITIRNCKFNDNQEEGASFFIQDALIENCEFNRNWKSEGKSSYGSGGLACGFADVVIRNCKFNNNGESGFRQDHIFENVRVEGCEFNGNTRAGIHLEVAKGPAVFHSCEISGNRGEFPSESKNGAVILATAWNQTFEKCRFLNNSGRAISIVMKERPLDPDGCQPGSCGLGAASFDVPFDSSMTNRISMVSEPNILNTKILGCTLVSQGSDDWLISKRCGDGNPQDYAVWAKTQYTGHGNVYWNPNETNMFQTDDAFSCSRSTYVDFETWKKFSGSEGPGQGYGSSVWMEPATTQVDKNQNFPRERENDRLLLKGSKVPAILEFRHPKAGQLDQAYGVDGRYLSVPFMD